MDLELRVDRIRCDGAGLCAELVPELVELDDWGYPIVRPGIIPEDLLDHARRAVDTCPVLALRLVPGRHRVRVGGPTFPRTDGSGWPAPAAHRA